jgi:hypothetical protein
MAWNQNIPQPTDQLSQSQNDLLNNFQAIQTLVDVNHVDFNAGANQGKHFCVTFPVQTVDPVPPTIQGSDVGLYTKMGPSGFSDIYINRPADALLAPITASNYLASTSANGGYSYLPSGLLIKWGATGAVAANPQTIIYPTGGSVPAFTVPALLILVMPTSTSPLSGMNVILNANAGTNTALQFQIYHNAGISADGFQWLAIGY